MKANVFKIETFGAVDGPSIRLVIFLQGCSFRCKYCHNPESWDVNKICQQMSVDDILSIYEENKAFYAKGGITISGGEPMLQANFIKELAIECNKRKIHLTIDTSACNFLSNKQDYVDLLNLVDLWIVDVKSLDPTQHKFITGSNQLTGKLLIELLENNKKAYWLRQVVIKTINDNDINLKQLASFIKTLKYCQKYELLSYHNLAYDKYERLNIDYPFKNIKMFTSQEFEEINSKLNKFIKK